jgi:hypothetical protein
MSGDSSTHLPAFCAVEGHVLLPGHWLAQLGEEAAIHPQVAPEVCRTSHIIELVFSRLALYGQV